MMNYLPHMMNFLKNLKNLLSNTLLSKRKKLFIGKREKLSETQNYFEKEKVNYDSLIKDNSSLQENILDLTQIVYKFTKGKKNFDLILGEQKCIFDKGGIGYNPFLKQKSLKNFFVKTSTFSIPNVICNFYNKNGHVTFNCSIKKRFHFESKYK